MRAMALRRIATLISVALWGASLGLPSYATPIEELSPGHAYAINLDPGWSLALTGWGGAFENAFAWYGNPLLVWCWWVLWNERLSSVTALASAAASLLGLLLALSALEPRHIEFGDDHGVNGLSYPLVGAYVWIASFVPIITASHASLLQLALTGRINSAPRTGRAE